MSTIDCELDSFTLIFKDYRICTW